MNLDDHRDIFNIFHDGSIVDIENENEDIKFTVEITYLAEMINPNYTKFYGIIKDCRRFDLRIWGDNSYITDNIESINKLNLEISKATVENEYIKVACWSHYEGIGGDLIISAEEIIIYDENMQQVTVNKLGEICDLYWNKGTV